MLIKNGKYQRFFRKHKSTEFTWLLKKKKKAVMFVSNQCTVLWYRMCNLSFFPTNRIIYEESYMFLDAIPFKNLLHLDKSKENSIMKLCIKQSVKQFIHIFCKSHFIYFLTHLFPSTTSCCLVAKSCLTPLWPHGLWPTKLLCPWGFPGKNTGASCHFFLPRDHPDPGIKHVSTATEPPGNPTSTPSHKLFWSRPQTTCHIIFQHFSWSLYFEVTVRK